MIPQAADRHQPDASSTPPSHPASGWRRDLAETTPDHDIKRAPPGAFRVDAAAIRLRPPDRPALVMVLAPLAGAALWAGLLALAF